MQLTHKAFLGKASIALALLTVGSLAAARPAAAQRVYDASADFSTTSNPSPFDGGVWSYGVESTLGSAFSLYTSTFSSQGNVSGSGIAWYDPGSFGNAPLVGFNNSGTTYILTGTDGTTTVLPGHLSIHPGANGEYSIIRFTAPTTSTFSFSGDFYAQDSRPTTTDVHVLLDNVSLADGGINVDGGGNTASLSSNSVALTKGDTLDFVVGYGNGEYYYDSTGLYAKVTDLNAVPQARTTLTLNDETGIPGQTVTLTARLVQKSGSLPLSGKTLSFSVFGKVVGTAVTNSNGIASLSYDIPTGTTIGNHGLAASFVGDSAYATSSDTETLTVTKANTTLTIANVSGTRGQRVTLTATLLRTLGSAPLSGKTLSFSVYGSVVGTGVTNGSGVASLSYVVPSGTSVGHHSLAASFAGDSADNPSSASGTLTVN